MLTGDSELPLRCECVARISSTRGHAPARSHPRCLTPPRAPVRIAPCAPRPTAGARLEEAIPRPSLRGPGARRTLAAGALTAALLAAPLARADFYRWTDSDGVTHYTQDLERVPRAYRASVQLVAPHISAAQGPLPLLDVAPGPGADEAGFEEPGLGARAPVPAPAPAPAQ